MYLSQAILKAYYFRAKKSLFKKEGYSLSTNHLSAMNPSLKVCIICSYSTTNLLVIRILLL